MKMEQTVFSETSAYKIQTPGNYPEENLQLSDFSLRKFQIFTTVSCVVWHCVLWNSNGRFGATFYCHPSWSKHSKYESLSFWKRLFLM